ncbi:MAG TPA: CopD family protein [Gaiellaceae bacterium]|nr:CopD family protein [Gaiellaceae bacterium]
MHFAALLLHVLAAAVWVGGTVALVFAGVPAVRKAPVDLRPELFRTLGRRWRPLGWGSLAVLGVTGLALAREHYAFRGSTLLDTDFGRGVLAKIVLLVYLLVGSYLHDYVLGPRLQDQVRAGAPQTIRPWLQRLGWLNFAVTLALPVLGVWLASKAHGF